MKNIISCAILMMMFLTVTANANNGPKKGSKNGPDKPVAIQNADFKGGNTEMLDYIHTNLKYPECARENALEGTVEISFFVLADGSIHGARVIDGFDTPCNNAALKVIQDMPNWTPATRNGQAVGSKHKVKINFNLEI